MQIQLSERTIIQRWQSGSGCQLIQDQTEFIANTLHSKAEQTKDQARMTEEKHKMEDASVSHYSSIQFE